jgi:phosphoadenosine phosphosulfate reductase
MAAVQKHYGLKLKLFYPNHENVERFTREHGINGFYDSVELRKACCHARKVEPLGSGAGRQEGVDHRHARAAVGHPQAWPNANSTRPTAWRSSTRSPTGARRKSGPTSAHDVPYNKLHDKFYPSIGCAPCTRPVAIGEDVRAGRWWWEDPDNKECGLHVSKA